MGIQVLELPFGDGSTAWVTVLSGVPSHDFQWCTEHRPHALFLGYSNLRSWESVSEMQNINSSQGSRQGLCFEHRECFIKGQVP